MSKNARRPIFFKLPVVFGSIGATPFVRPSVIVFSVPLTLKKTVMGDLSTDFFLYQKLNQPTHAQLNAWSNKTASLTAKSQSNVLRSTGRLFELFGVHFLKLRKMSGY